VANITQIPVDDKSIYLHSLHNMDYIFEALMCVGLGSHIAFY